MTTSNTRTGVQPVTTTYSYDEQGQRVKKKTGSVLNEYVVRDHAGRELAIYDASSNLLKQVNIYGRSLEGRYDVRWDYVQVPVEEDIDPSGYITVLQKTVTGTYYYIKDHPGSIRQTVKRDAAGSFAILRNYYPYGSVMNETVVGGTTDRYQYTGKERDKETGLDYFGARYYACPAKGGNSDLGVWLSIDPMADKYHGWSPYNYCLNNPLNFVYHNGDSVDYRLTTEQLKKFNEERRKNKNLDNEYKALESSPKWFVVKSSTTTTDGNGNKIGGYFKPLGDGNGSKEKPVGEIGISQFDGENIFHEGFHAKEFNDKGYDAYLENQSYTTFEARAYMNEYRAGYTPSAVPPPILKLLDSKSSLTRESGWMQLNQWVGKYYRFKQVHE